MIDAKRHKRIQEKMNSEEEWEAIDLAGRILGKRGFRVYASMFPKNANTVGDIKTCSDNGDIFLYDITDGSCKIVEVKRLSKDNFSAYFTDRDSWKFADFIVDGVNQFDKKTPVPYLYMCFNHPLSAVALVYTRTKDNWTIVKRNGNESMKSYYTANLDDVKFKSVKELLNG